MGQPSLFVIQQLAIDMRPRAVSVDGKSNLIRMIEDAEKTLGA